MGSSREQAKNAVDRATAAGGSLTTIAKSVSRINDMSTQIASAAEEQSAVSEEINRNIVRLNDMTERNSEAADETSVASHELASISTDLQAVVGQFKV